MHRCTDVGKTRSTMRRSGRSAAARRPARSKDAKVKVYEAFIVELGRRGSDATVEDVYDAVTRRLSLAVAVEEAS